MYVAKIYLYNLLSIVHNKVKVHASIIRRDVYAFTTGVCYTSDTPFSITGTHVGVVAPVCKVHACVMLPLVGTVRKNDKGAGSPCLQKTVLSTQNTPVHILLYKDLF